MEDSPDPLNVSADDHASLAGDKQSAPFGVPGQVASGGVRPRLVAFCPRSAVALLSLLDLC